MTSRFTSTGVSFLDAALPEGRLQRELCASLGLHETASPDHLTWGDVYTTLEEANRTPLSLEEQDVVDSWDRLLATLSLPPTPKTFQVALSEEGGIGEDRFRVFASLSIDGSPVETSERIGGVVEDSTGTPYLLPVKCWALLEAVDSPVPPRRPWVSRQGWWARVRRLAEEAGAQLSTHLQREKPALADSVSLAVSADEQGAYRLDPDIADVDPKSLGDAIRRTPLADRPTHRLRHEDGSRQTVVTAGRSGEAFRAVKRLDRIDDETLTLLKISPEEVLETDAFNLEDFGPRVKGIGPPVYHAVPFISQLEGRGGWFDWDAGITLTDSNGEQTGKISFKDEEEASRFKAAWKVAKDEGKKTFEFNGARLLVDDIDPKAVERAVKKTAKALENQEPGAKKKVLQIWENIDNLDFDLGDGESFSFDWEDWSRPPEMADHIVLKSYQVDGFRWLVRAALQERGALLADEMGLGKTVQVLALLSALKEAGKEGPVLVVAPASLLENWAEEADKFFPDRFPVIKVFRGGRAAVSETVADVLICSYETLQRRQLEFGRVSWAALVFDEAQKAKNPRTRISSALKAMQAKVRVAVTGTPVENSLIEMWNIFDTVRPGYLDSLKQFSGKYVRNLPPAGSDERELLSTELQERVAPIFLRREREAFLSDELPSAEEHHLPVAMNDLLKSRYLDIVSQAQGAGRGEILALIGRLLAVCSDPRLHHLGSLDEGDDQSPKLQVLLELLEKQVRPNGEKALIFTRLLDLQQIIRRALSARFGIDAPVLNGMTPGRQRLSLVDGFNESSGFNVMILGPRAGGVGLNIVGANHVVHFTREWNPAIEAQATARVHRIGQTRPVHVYLPVVQGPELTVISAEQRLHNLLAEKSRLASDFLSPIADASVSLDDMWEGIGGDAEPYAAQEIELDALSPRDLEFLVGVLLTKEGWETEVTRAQNDHGVDVVADRSDVRMVVQVKHSAEVSADAVGEVVSGEPMYPFTQGRTEKWLFVTGRVTQEARLRAEANDVHVVERADLINRISGADVTLEELRRRREIGF